MVRPFAAMALALVLSRGAGAEEPPQPSPSPTAPAAHPADAATLFPRENLRALPRPSDPWSLLREVPGIALDRVNVGGSETALQSFVVSGGDGGAGTVWTLDGVDVTDPSALGSLAVFPDMDSVEGVLVRTRAVDVRVHTPGARVDLQLLAPPERLRGEVHFRGSDGALQADNAPDERAARPLDSNRTERLSELGAQLGGAFREGTVRLWGAFARNALRQQAFTDHEEELRVTDVALKARWDGRAGTLSALGLRSEKVHEGRDTGLATDPSARWRQSGPAYLFALEGRRNVSGYDTLARVSYLDGGFRLEAEGGPQQNVFEDFRGVLQGSYYSFETDRPRLQALLESQGTRDGLGLRHGLLAGVGYRRSQVDTTQVWPGNQVLGLERQSVFFRAFGLTGFALPTRAQAARSVHDHLEAYAQDRMRRGRWEATLGLRLDRQAGRNLESSVEANPLVPRLLPAVSFPGTPSRFTWLDLLPRAALSFDLEASAKTVARAWYAEYGAQLGSGDVTFDNPIGRETASLTYYWLDRNGDHVVQAGELDLLRGRLGSAGIDPRQPASTVSPHAIDPDYRAPRTREVSGSLETERWGVRAVLRASWRRHTQPRYAPLRNLTTADYVIRGAVEGTLFGEPYSVGYFAPASESRIVPGIGRLLTNREGYRQESGTVEAAFAGRAGAHVRWAAWGAYADWREYFDDREVAVQDPTPLESEPLDNAGRVAVRATGLGRGDLFVHGRWNAGATLQARLPFRLECAAVLNARDGFPIPYFQAAGTGDPTAGTKNVLVAPDVDTYRLPAVVLLDARLARGFGVGGGTLTAAADVFNLLNEGTALQVSRDVELPVLGRPRELMRPRILRLGLAYSF
ncbi:MAG TPA: hypothetical protein VFQ51_11330 [Vicinamibacteria bacterium]|nr:hypothetical protein [Vicinamibacteria bacterium]